MTPAPQLRFWLSLAVGLVLQLLDLPEAIATARPMWLPMVLAFWALYEPRVPTLLAALLFGLLLDGAFASPLGQHALGLVLLVFVVIRLRSLFGLLPMVQSMFVLAPIWAAFTLLMFWLDGIDRHASDPWLRWLPVLSTALFWPLVHITLESVRRQRRSDD